VKRVKYHAQQVKGCTWCHNTHGSKIEARECAHLHMLKLEQGGKVVWVDVFPVVTLPGGEHWKLDFCVYEQPVWGEDIIPVFVDVKGCETSEFKRKRKVFDTYHPARPLRIVKYSGKRRIVTGNPE